MSTATSQEAAARLVRAIKVVQDKKQLFGSGSLWEMVHKQQTESFSNQGEDYGDVAQPFNMKAANNFVCKEIYHSTCIETKVAACVGLGHVKEESEKRSKAAEKLDDLTDSTWQNLLAKVAQDYFGVANGYIEIVREGFSGPLLGAYHIPAPDVTIHVSRTKTGKLVKHYTVEGMGAGLGIHERKFAAFGDKERFMREHSRSESDAGAVSEVIHIPRPSSLHRWYGIPDWLAAVPLMELMGMIYQYLFDFFQNRGVPEFMLFLKGGKLSDEDWTVIEDAMKAQIGSGNSHKSIALNIDEDIEVQLEKLALEHSADATMFKEISEASALSIVSAHRVPPLLAGIQIPGKLGATNELPNALKSFQALVMGPAQHTFQSALGCTLGDESKNGGLGLTQDDFGFRKITEEIEETDMTKTDTVSRMRTTLAEANAEGRDPADGLKD